MQSYVADVGTERRRDGSYNHQVVIWTVPRQTGKTTGLRAIGTHRCLVCGRDVYYTAQTGKDARKRWEDLVKILRADPKWNTRIKISLRGGSEAVTFPGGAAFNVFAPTPESLHSYTPPCVFIDEAFALAPGAGELLMGAISPGQLTIADKQIWIVSTMGTAESTFLHEWIDRAIDGEPRVAIFDWGARDDQDPYDLDDIAAFHPGVGFNFNGKILVPADVLEETTKNSRAEYERAYANRRTVTTSHTIPIEDWIKLRVLDDVELSPPAGCVLTYDVGADQEGATLLATWNVDDVPHVQVIAAAPGLHWLGDAVVAARDLLRPRDIAAASNGPVVEVNSDLLARGVDVHILTEREYAAASGGLLTAITTQGVRHDGSARGTDPLAQSIAGLVPRAGAVDGIAFSRRHSVGDSSAGIAAAIGLHRNALLTDSKPFVQFA